MTSDLRELGEWGIAANVDADDSTFRKGARVMIQGWHGDYSSVRVNGPSRGGRRVVKYVQFKKLTNFRAAFIPEKIDEFFERSTTKGYISSRWKTKEEAQASAEKIEADWSLVQRGTRGSCDGPMTRPGMSENEMQQRPKDACPICGGHGFKINIDMGTMKEKGEVVVTTIEQIIPCEMCNRDKSRVADPPQTLLDYIANKSYGG